MIVIRRALLIASVVIVGVTGTCLWGVTQNATVSGLIRDASNQPVRNVTVVLTSETRGITKTGKTDDSGIYTFEEVPPAPDYLLRTTINGSDWYFYQDVVAVAVYEQRVVVPDFQLPLSLTAVVPPPTPSEKAPPAVAGQQAPPGKTQPSVPENATVAGFVRNRDRDHTPASGATVRLVSATGAFSQEQTTDTAGNYAFSNVPPSQSYVLTVTKAGSQQVQKQLRIPAGTSKLTIPILLGLPPVHIELASSTLSTVIDSQAVRTLPLADRDFLDLALLAAGAYPVEQGSSLQGASLVVNGVRANMNNFLLDGADNNDYTINQSLPFQLVEAMQEFRVQASTSTAEFGRNAGAQINTISRRGLNAVHGTLFEFNRNSALSADNFFSVYSGGTFDEYAQWLKLNGLGDPLSDPTLASIYNQRKAPSNQNQFGGNIGGPLKKDKLFGFFNYEGFRVSNPRPVFERVPENCLRSGTTFASCTASLPQGPYSLDPLAEALYNLYPAPNVPASALSTVPTTQYPLPLPFSQQSTGPAFFVGQSANSTSTDNYLGRLDWQGQRSSLSFKYNAQNIGQVQGGNVPRTPNYPGNGNSVDGRNQSFSLGYTSSIKADTVNELRVAWNRFALNVLPLDRTLDPSSFGFQNLYSTQIGLPTLSVGGLGSQEGTVEQVITPYAQLGSNWGAPDARADNVWSISEALSLVRGRHSLKLGAEYRYVRLDALNQAAARGLLGFYDGFFVGATGTPDVGSIARVSSDFGGFDRDFRTQSLDWFVQDRWQLNRNLTVNLGVRYEVNTAPTETRNRLVNYYPALNALVRGGTTTEYDPFGDVIGTAPSAVPRAGFYTDKSNYGPRFGLAWNPGGGKTVLRGAYAVVFDQQPLQPSVNMLLNPPFVYQDFSFFCPQPPSALYVANPTCANTLGPDSGGFSLEQTFGINSPSVWFQQPYSVTGRDPNTRTPYVQQFNLGIQRQLGTTIVAEVVYLGSAGRKLPRLRDISPCPPQVFFGSPSTCLTQISNPFLTTSILQEEDSATSSFNSLQASLDTRGFHGLRLGAHYEWAKSIDNASSLQPQAFLDWPLDAMYLSSVAAINPATFTTVNSISPTLSLQPTLPIISTRPTLPQDSANLGLERGLSDFDVRNRLVFDYIYAVPRLARLGLLGKGWEVAGITTIQSGQPYSVFTDSFGLSLRPDVRGTVAVNNRTPQAAIDNGIPLAPPVTSDQIFMGQGCSPTSDSVFDVAPNCGLTAGNLGRNTLSGPGLVNFDFSVLKDTSLGGEGRSVQFRAEFFNLFNRANFYQPYSRAGIAYTDFCASVSTATNSCNTSAPAPAFIPDPFFGQILQARPAREIQFALKFTF